MSVLKLTGTVDIHGVLSALVPDSIPPGPVTVLIVGAPEEDISADDWTAGLAREWADDLADQKQDIYTLGDGEPIGDSR